MGCKFIKHWKFENFIGISVCRRRLKEPKNRCSKASSGIRIQCSVICILCVKDKLIPLRPEEQPEVEEKLKSSIDSHRVQLETGQCAMCSIETRPASTLAEEKGQGQAGEGPEWGEGGGAEVVSSS